MSRLAISSDTPFTPLNDFLFPQGLPLTGGIKLSIPPNGAEMRCYQIELSLMVASHRQRIDEVIYGAGVPLEIRRYWEVKKGMAIAIPIAWCRRVAV